MTATVFREEQMTTDGDRIREARAAADAELARLRPALTAAEAELELAAEAARRARADVAIGRTPDRDAELARHQAALEARAALEAAIAEQEALLEDLAQCLAEAESASLAASAAEIRAEAGPLLERATSLGIELVAIARRIDDLRIRDRDLARRRSGGRARGEAGSVAPVLPDILDPSAERLLSGISMLHWAHLLVSGVDVRGRPALPESVTAGGAA